MAGNSSAKTDSVFKLNICSHLHSPECHERKPEIAALKIVSAKIFVT